jgi:HAD superfamily hydrolase (TIGR01509 family)
MTTSKAVIFDMDGVLADTEPVYMSITRDLLSNLGFPLTLEELFPYVGISAKRMWSELGSSLKLQPPLGELIRLEKERQVQHLSGMNQIPEIPGVRPLLEELSQMGIPMAVASSSSREIVDLILSKAGLRRFFTAIVNGQDVSQRKPAPDIFLKAAAMLGVEPVNCVVVEDSTPGVEGAKKAGMVCIGFANAHSGNPDLSSADLVLYDFSAESRQKIKRLIQ